MQLCQKPITSDIFGTERSHPKSHVPTPSDSDWQLGVVDEDLRVLSMEGKALCYEHALLIPHYRDDKLYWAIYATKDEGKKRCRPFFLNLRVQILFTSCLLKYGEIEQECASAHKWWKKESKNGQDNEAKYSREIT